MTFNYLPKDTEIYIEAICMKTKRFGFIEIDNVNNNGNLSLITKDMNTFYDDEYDLLDRGYYSI